MSPNEQKLVLFIDDEPDLLELAQILLEAQDDFVVVTARDGRRALRLLDAFEPDVIVTDMMMPVLDGFGFLREYKARGMAAPVIATSAFEPYLEHARALGAEAVLPKPFETASLIPLIREVAARKRTAGPHPRPTTGEEAAEEHRRLHAILDMGLDQPAPEPGLHRFIDEVAAFFDVPVALISVVTTDRQFWTAGCGIPEDLAVSRGTPREESFCTHAVAARAALVVQDTLDHPFFHHNVLVETRGLRFYAGVPLIARHGEALGTLCLLDFQARHFTHTDLEILSVFGRRVLAVIEWRERTASPEIPQGAFRYLEYLDRDLDIFGAAGFRDVACIEAARSVEAGIPIACVVLAVPLRRLREVAESLRERYPRSLVGRLGHARLGWLCPALTAGQAREAALALAGPHGFAEAVDLGQYAGAVRTALKNVEQTLGDAGLA
jgi:CheY-like chemotaxis protein